jgi:hypothetical protein
MPTDCSDTFQTHDGQFPFDCPSISVQPFRIYTPIITLDAFTIALTLSLIFSLSAWTLSLVIEETTCVFGKPASSRILGLFPGGFAATTSG